MTEPAKPSVLSDHLEASLMEYFGSTIIVIAVLVAVAVAAVTFQPANPLQQWLKLADQYGTSSTPSEVQFADQRIKFGGQRGTLQPLNSFVSFDATIDDFGLWLVLKGTDNPDITPALRIPGTHVRPAGERGGSFRFDLYAEPPVRIAVGAELGEQLQLKCKPG